MLICLRYGRKIVFIISLVLQVVFGMLAAVAPEFWSFTLCRAVVAATTSGVFLVAYVIGIWYELLDLLKYFHVFYFESFGNGWSRWTTFGWHNTTRIFLRWLYVDRSFRILYNLLALFTIRTYCTWYIFLMLLVVSTLVLSSCFDLDDNIWLIKVHSGISSMVNN